MKLPSARGPVSATVISALSHDPHDVTFPAERSAQEVAHV